MAAPHAVLLGSYAPSLVRFRGPLMAALRARGYRVTAVTGPAEPGVLAELAELGVAHRAIAIERASANPAQDARLLLELVRLFRELRPELVLSYTIKPVIYGSLAARLVGVPRRAAMITGLGYAFSPARGLGHRAVAQVAQTLLRSALGACQHVLFQNPDDRALFEARGLVRAGQRTAVVRGSGVDVAYYAPAPLPAGPPLFLFVGRLLADKGVREVAQMARRLRERTPQVRFRLVGALDPNPSSVRPEELARWLAAGWVEHAGEVVDVRPELARAHVVVLPSVREGTPRAVLEAMSMQRAVITTDAPGCRETVVHGESGLLVPPRDVEALIAAGRRLLEEPALIAELAAGARRRVVELYDAHRVAAHVLEVLEA